MTEKYAGKYIHCSFGGFDEQFQSTSNCVHYLDEKETKNDEHSFKIPSISENNERFVAEGILVLENKTVICQEKEDKYIDITTKKSYKIKEYEDIWLNWEDVCELLKDYDEEESDF